LNYVKFLFLIFEYDLYINFKKILKFKPKACNAKNNYAIINISVDLKVSLRTL